MSDGMIHFQCPVCFCRLASRAANTEQTIECPECDTALAVPFESQRRNGQLLADEAAIEFRAPDSDTEAEVDMTPMVDVTFLLLIFFMVTANFVRESELRSTLWQDQQGSGAASDLRPQIITIRRTGERFEFLLGERVISTQRELTELLGQLPKDGGVFVRAPGDVTVEPVAAALQAASDAGFLKVSYVPIGS